MTLLDSYGELPAVFSHWGLGSEITSRGEISFDIGTTPDESTPIWRLDLPDEPESAWAQIRDTEQELAQSRAALADVPDRLDALVARLEAGEGLSFDVSTARDADKILFQDPEIELLGWIDGLDTERVSFGLGELVPEEMVDASQQFRGVIAGLSRMLLHLAWVETHQKGHLLARTVVNWSGDMDTAWGWGITREQFEYHHRSLALALASRITLLNTLSITTRAAVKLSVLIATPGASLLALPAAWKYVNQILAQVRKYSDIREQSKENESWQTNSKTH
jgi:hypothetical protein